MVQGKIKIERQYGNNYSYFMDVNGLLKGEWGGFSKLYDSGPNGEAMFGIYYCHFNRIITINEYGFFYNKFSCKKYDGILKLPATSLYICEKNGRFGLINEDEETILHTVYKEISPYIWGVVAGYGIRQISMLYDHLENLWREEYRQTLFCIVATETGKFLLNISKKKESSVYDDIIFSDIEEKPQIIFKSGNKYGALDIDGNVIIKPHFECSQFRHALFYRYQDMLFKVWADNGLLYEKISASKYDVCFRVGSYYLDYESCFFISRQGEKYGLISNAQKLVSAPVLDEVFLYESPNKCIKGSMHKTFFKDADKKKQRVSFVIARTADRYKLFNLENGNLVLDNCDSIKYLYSRKRDQPDLIAFSKGDMQGFVLYDETIISTGIYDEVESINGYIRVKKDGKTKVFKINGEQLDSVEEYESPNLQVTSKFHSSYEKPTYEQYAGSYAQDEMCYTDDDVDTIFDGDPTAYWNID